MKRNAILAFATTWIEMEIIFLSKTSHILSSSYDINITTSAFFVCLYFSGVYLVLTLSESFCLAVLLTHKIQLGFLCDSFCKSLTFIKTKEKCVRISLKSQKLCIKLLKKFCIVKKILWKRWWGKILLGLENVFEWIKLFLPYIKRRHIYLMFISVRQPLIIYSCFLGSHYFLPN